MKLNIQNFTGWILVESVRQAVKKSSEWPARPTDLANKDFSLGIHQQYDLGCASTTTGNRYFAVLCDKSHSVQKYASCFSTKPQFMAWPVDAVDARMPLDISSPINKVMNNQ